MPPRFVSPGAMARNEMEAFLLRQAEDERRTFLANLAAEEERRRAAQDQQEIEARTAAAMAATEQRRQTEALETARRQDAAGVRGMMADVITNQPPTPETGRSVAALALREGVPVPGIVDRMMAPPARTAVTTTDAQGNPLRKTFTEEELAAGVPEYRAPKAEPAGREQPYQWVIRNGKQTYTNQVLPGDAPASRSGGGRSVTAGTAVDIAELDTSLDDVDVLARDLGTTGTGSRIGAALPGVITEVTGLGASSKSRQAVIDRVKQVIGKALEGGVLRKEDEVKYAKILPTIADPPAVAASKIKGLRAALVQRRQRLLESLADAGFDVSNYPEGRTAAGDGTPKVGDIKTFPNGRKGRWDGTGWEAVTPPSAR